jgi:hypothetical protein
VTAVDLAEYRDQARSLRVRGLLWLTLGLPVTSLGGAAFVLGTSIAAFPRSIPDDDVFIGVGALVVIGMALLLIGGLPCLLGMRALWRLRRLRLDTARERLLGENQ